VASLETDRYVGKRELQFNDEQDIYNGVEPIGSTGSFTKTDQHQQEDWFKISIEHRAIYML